MFILAEAAVPTTTVHPIDQAIILVYFAGVIAIGLRIGRYVRSSKDLFLAGRRLPWWAIGMSLVATDIGATDMIGLAGNTYRDGIAWANFDWIGCLPAMILAAFIFMPIFWMTGAFTIPGYLGRRYNEAVRCLVAITWGTFMIANIGIILVASAEMFAGLLGWPFAVSILVTASVVGIYTLFGGLAAVVLTDVAQVTIMIVGTMAILIIGFVQVGGWSGLVDAIHGLGPEYSNHLHLVLPASTNSKVAWPGVILGLTLVLSPAYWIGNQAVVQRALGARSERDARAGFIWGAMLKTLIPVLMVFPGLIAVAAFSHAIPIGQDGTPDSDQALPILIRELLPPGLTGLVVAAFLGALMSSVDSYINSAATVWIQDIYRPHVYRKGSDRHYLLLGRILTIVFIVLGFGFAYVVKQRFESIYDAFQSFLSIFQGPLLALLLLGIFWKRTTGWGGFFGLLVGIATAITLFAVQDTLLPWGEPVFKTREPFLYYSWWSFVAAMIVTITVSLFTRPHGEDHLRSLVYGLWRRARRAS